MLALRWIIPRHLIKHRLAAFSTNSRCHRDLIAKYRYRPPARVEEAEEYLTSATVPVTSSIQAVPSSAELSTPTWEKVNDVPFTGRKATPLPAMEPLHHEQSKEVKPQAEEIHVAGVIVPPKPSPPESDECCMSGCVNCVYTLYADDLLAYNESLANALTALRTSGTPQSSWPADIRAFAEKGRAVGDDSAAAFGSSRRDVVDEAEKMTREEIMRDVLEDVDPALRAFLELENKIKARH